MIGHTCALTFGYLGAGIGVTVVVPQIVRIIRHPTLTGVSPLTWSLTTLGSLTWLVYGVRTGTFPQVPGNVLLVSGAAAIVVTAPAASPNRLRAARLALAATAVVAIALVLPPTSDGYLAFAIGLASAWPQVFDSVMDRRRPGASGVSVPSWALKVCSQCCWLTYALATGDRPVTLGACVALTTAVGLVAVESSRRIVTTGRDVVLEPA